VSFRYFKISEFACRHCGENLIDHIFVEELDQLRHELGFPLIVSSGYRCPEYNKQVAHTGEKGPHTTGRAVDLSVAREQAYKVIRLATEKGFTGIGVSQKGESRFLHLDNLPNAPGQPRPTIWSY
jgi:uncharacterized protein YcbK (DUF882 family)